MALNNTKIANNIVPKVVIATILLGVAALIGSLTSADTSSTNQVAGISSSLYPEVKEIQNEHLSSFKQLSKYFTELANKKGAEYAFKVLGVAELPPNTDMHLLGHTVGDALYKQKGIEGIKTCTQDFRNACSHSIVVGLLLEKGEGVLPQIAETCKQAPGGSGAYTMCFHGLGHGVLAYAGYDMPKAVELCEKTGTKEYNNREAIECIGGTIMEIISGGFHNQELWATQSKKYLPADHPLYPCESDYMPADARNQCYAYLTPHLWAVAGGQKALSSPTSDDLKKAFLLCEKLSQNDPARNSCYAGFGKEFVGLSKARDIRNVDKMTAEEIMKVDYWCGLAPSEEAVRACLLSAAGSIYWGGENDRSGVIKFCGGISNASFRDGCFADAIGMVRYYITDTNYRKQFCAELPEKYRTDCLNNLLQDY